jgi:hypothetical protein
MVMTTVNKITKQKLTTEYDELYQQILDATGIDLFGNKALTKYLNSGMSGKMQEIFDVIENDVHMWYPAQSRKVMTFLVYNRHMNGGKVPGTEFGIEDFMEHSDIRVAAFKEVKAETFIRWETAINLIDRYKLSLS